MHISPGMLMQPPIMGIPPALRLTWLMVNSCDCGCCRCPELSTSPLFLLLSTATGCSGGGGAALVLDDFFKELLGDSAVVAFFLEDFFLVKFLLLSSDAMVDGAVSLGLFAAKARGKRNEGCVCLDLASDGRRVKK